MLLVITVIVNQHFAIKWLVSIATCGGKGPRRLMRNLDIPSLCLNPQFQLMYEFPTKKRDKYTLPPLLTCNSQNWLALTRTAMASMSTGPWGGSSNGQMAFIKLHKNYLNSCFLAITPNNPAESIIIIDAINSLHDKKWAETANNNLLKTLDKLCLLKLKRMRKVNTESKIQVSSK